MTNRTQDNVVSLREEALKSNRSVLDELVREGARRILQEALELELEEFLHRYRGLRDEEGRQAMVRNGYLPQREVISGVGPLPRSAPLKSRHL